MIKCLFLIYRARHVNREEFTQYWEQSHGPIAIKTAPPLRIRRYVQNHSNNQHPVARQFAESRACVRGDFDGVAEAWWDSFEAIANAAGELPQHIGEMILEDERSFIDMERSIIWFGEEKVLFEG